MVDNSASAVIPSSFKVIIDKFHALLLYGDQGDDSQSVVHNVLKRVEFVIASHPVPHRARTRVLTVLSPNLLPYSQILTCLRHLATGFTPEASSHQVPVSAARPPDNILVDRDYRCLPEICDEIRIIELHLEELDHSIDATDDDEGAITADHLDLHIEE